MSHFVMTTITLQVPKEFSKQVSTWKWEEWLRKFWEFQQDQQDIELVEHEKSKKQTPISLDDFLDKCEK